MTVRQAIAALERSRRDLTVAMRLLDGVTVEHPDVARALMAVQSARATMHEVLTELRALVR
jgi:hypothetical protein